MGEEISESHFTETDFRIFQEQLERESIQLKQWFEQKRFSQAPERCGFELEAWLVDQDFRPAARNHEFIDLLKDPDVTPELANFNIEFNYTPQDLAGSGLQRIHQDMHQRWHRSQVLAQELGMQLVVIGILPTVRPSDLTPENLSSLHRYRLLNEQILKLREGRPLRLDIQGADILRMQQNDVMLESAATSFQIHYQIPLAVSRRSYNAAIIASAPLLGISANSPFLFGKDLWQETRIPLFEQSVEVGGYEPGSHGPMRRVTFGSGYANESLFECFQENLLHYPVLLPSKRPASRQYFEHLRMHNGTLWRWNRPLIGVVGDQYHLRIEHRAIPAGPTIVDCVANAAMFYGLVHQLSHATIAPEHEIPFSIARDNFYSAAQKGLQTQLIWKGGIKHSIRSLVLRELLPAAAEGLQALSVAPRSIGYYLDIIEKRVQTGMNGAAWQRGFVEKYGADMTKLTAVYIENQNSGLAVHEWEI
ncbi:MAG: glutamate--cysteine ligase [Thiohalomonadales bacterium]